MSEPPEDPGPDSTGPPDRQTLRLLERHLTSDSLVVETTFDLNPYEPRRLYALLDARRYPESIPAARLDIRWFTTGDFSIHHVEEHDDGDSGSVAGIDIRTHTTPGCTFISHQPPRNSPISRLCRFIHLTSIRPCSLQ